MRAIVTSLGIDRRGLPPSCELLLADIETSEWPVTADGSAIWPLLDDCDVVWLDATTPSSGRDVLLVAATACAIPVFAPAAPAPLPPGVSVSVAPSLEDVIARFDLNPVPPTPSGGLGRLQRYYGRMVALRDYGTNDPLEGMLLLTEEVGELAHAIRREVGIGRKQGFPAGLDVAMELADVQLYLLALSNILDCSLADAVREKERTNHSRAAEDLPRPPTPPQPLSFVAIEGLIGSGKTTTARLVGDALGATTVYERVESHPFIEAFYKDQFAHALELELVFVLMRWHDVRRANGSPLIVADFSPFKDIVFSGFLLDRTEMDLVRRTYHELWAKAPLPDFVVFIDAGPELALRRIAERNRTFERGIDLDYLVRLEAEYKRLLRHLGKEVIELVVDADEPPETVADRVLDAIRAR